MGEHYWEMVEQRVSAWLVDKSMLTTRHNVWSDLLAGSGPDSGIIYVVFRAMCSIKKGENTGFLLLCLYLLKQKKAIHLSSTFWVLL